MTADAPLKKTIFWQTHIAAGGKMVGFAGYDMPVQYDGIGVLKEHLHTRQYCGLFDVSHMGQAIIHDPDHALEKIIPSDLQNLAIGKTRYTVLLNERGGIVDDLMITRASHDRFFLVVNAGCKEKDFAYINKTCGQQIAVTRLEDRALLALQGPLAEKVLVEHFPEITHLSFMDQVVMGDIFITRSGYTGEDGFEISIPNHAANDFAAQLLKNQNVKWIGLGARDSLRLEAGLCLYGHDLDETISPVEANIKWVIQKRRRDVADFLGAARILAEIKDGAKKYRVGIQPEGKAPLREGTELLSPTGDKLGVITSGGFGPSMDAPVAMGYVDAPFAAVGTELKVHLRGTDRICRIVPLPFTPHKYKKD